MYLLLVTTHVLAAIVGFGTLVTIPVIRASSTPARALDIEFRLAARVLTPALTWSLASGVIQVFTGPYRFGLLWIDTSLTLLLVALGITGAGAARPARRALAGERDPAATLRRLATSWSILAALGIAIVALMVSKPS